MVNAQNQKKSHEDPACTVSQINTEKGLLESVCNPVLNKPKPKHKEEPPKDTKENKDSKDKEAKSEAEPEAKNGEGDQKPEAEEQYVRRRNKKYVIRQSMDNILIDNYIDETKMKLVELQVRERETENELKLMYKDFRVLNNQAFPYSAFASLIHFNEFGQLETQMNIEHSRVEVPEKELNFPFNIPNKYVRQQ